MHTTTINKPFERRGRRILAVALIAAIGATGALATAAPPANAQAGDPRPTPSPTAGPELQVPNHLRPDLAVTNVDVLGMDIRVTVTNVSMNSAPPSRLVVCKNRAPESPFGLQCLDPIAVQTTIGALAPGASQTVAARLTVCINKRWHVMADWEERIAEANESNNHWYFPPPC